MQSSKKKKQLEKRLSLQNHLMILREYSFVQNACNYWPMGNFEQSRKTIQKALEIHNKNTQLLLTLGFTELSAGQFKEAGIVFEDILRLDSDNFDAWFNLAVTKAKTGCLDEALAYFRQAEKRQKDDQLLKANILTILQDLNRIDVAKREIGMLNSTMRSSKEIKAVEASLLMTEEKYSEASIILHELTKAILKPKHWLNWSTCHEGTKICQKSPSKCNIVASRETLTSVFIYSKQAEMGKLKS